MVHRPNRPREPRIKEMLGDQITERVGESVRAAVDAFRRKMIDDAERRLGLMLRQGRVVEELGGREILDVIRTMKFF